MDHVKSEMKALLTDHMLHFCQQHLKPYDVVDFKGEVDFVRRNGENICIIFEKKSGFGEINEHPDILPTQSCVTSEPPNNDQFTTGTSDCNSEAQSCIPNHNDNCYEDETSDIEMESDPSPKSSETFCADDMDSTHNTNKGNSSKHAREELHYCTFPECERAYINQASLSDHIKLRHTREKRYICKYCSRGFTHSGECHKHEKTHSRYKSDRCITKVRPYKCDVCSDRFTRKHHLTQHARTHTGEKPYQCAHCQQSFAAKSNLSKHMKIHDREDLETALMQQENLEMSIHLLSHFKTHKDLSHSLIEQTLNVLSLPGVCQN